MSDFYHNYGDIIREGVCEKIHNKFIEKNQKEQISAVIFVLVCETISLQSQWIVPYEV